MISTTDTPDCGITADTAAAFHIIVEHPQVFGRPATVAMRPLKIIDHLRLIEMLPDADVQRFETDDTFAKHPGTARRLRIGGLVENGSLVTSEGGKRFDFKVTDGKTDLAVSYVGVVPALFREGQGVVAEGRLGPDGSFAAATLLAKHDEKYMPPEVAEALKRSGEWRPDQQAAAPGAADAPASPTSAADAPQASARP